MVVAGWSAEQAWLAIGTSHRFAMGKARNNGRAWWTAHVWNRAVAYAAAHPAAPLGPQDYRLAEAVGQAGPGSEVTEAVRGLQAAFLASWGRYGRDRRHTLRFVLDTVCERMVRTGSATVPCPERDLVIDTGITSRRVLREALAQLDADGWLVLRRSFDPTQDAPGARSHHVSLPESSPRTPPLSGFLPHLVLSHPCLPGSGPPSALSSGTPGAPCPQTPPPASTCSPPEWAVPPSQDSAGTRCAPCWAGCSGWRWWGWRCVTSTGPGCG